jgi:hypothetical protein
VYVGGNRVLTRGWRAVFVAEFNPEPAKCTGRFANITGGSWIMVAVSDPFFITGTSTTPFNYRWEGQGQLVFGDAARRRSKRNLAPKHLLSNKR